MPTYTTSQQNAELQTYIFKAANIDVAGKSDLIGVAKSVYVLQVSNGDGSVRYVSMFDALTLSSANAVILFPVDANTDMTVYIDVGVAFQNRLCMNGSDAVVAGGNPTDLDITVLAK